MRSEFFPVLGLAARANAFLRGAPGRMEVLAGHPSFVRFHDLAFMRQTGMGLDIVAEGSLPWFRKLRNEGVPRVRPLTAGMALEKGGDAEWGILSEGDRGLEMWAPSVGRRFRGHDDAQPLRLTITSGRFDRWSLKPPLSVEDASQALLAALEGAKAHLEGHGQSVAASAVGKFLNLHLMESPELSGELVGIATDVAPCSLPLFASASRVLTLIETTGWMHAVDDSARALAGPLWSATRAALETAV